MNMTMEYWWTDTNGRKPKNSEKTHPSVTLSITYPVWTGSEYIKDLTGYWVVTGNDLLGYVN
jgi:hypothetical protein